MTGILRFELAHDAGRGGGERAESSAWSGTGGLGMSIINLISPQTQLSPLLNNPLTSSGSIKGGTWTRTSPHTDRCQFVNLLIDTVEPCSLPEVR